MDGGRRRAYVRMEVTDMNGKSLAKVVPERHARDAVEMYCGVMGASPPLASEAAGQRQAHAARQCTAIDIGAGAPDNSGLVRGSLRACVVRSGHEGG